jgi:hypothetical protein
MLMVAVTVLVLSRSEWEFEFGGAERDVFFLIEIIYWVAL